MCDAIFIFDNTIYLAPTYTPQFYSTHWPKPNLPIFRYYTTVNWLTKTLLSFQSIFVVLHEVIITVSLIMAVESFVTKISLKTKTYKQQCIEDTLFQRSLYSAVLTA